MPRRYIGEGLLDLVVNIWPKLNARFHIMRAAYYKGSTNPFAAAFDNVNTHYKMARPVFQYIWACSVEKKPVNISEMCRQLEIKSRSNASNIISAFKEIGALDEKMQPTAMYLAMARQRILAVLNEPIVKSFVLAANAYYGVRRVNSIEDIGTDTCLWQDGIPDAINQKDIEVLISSGFGESFDPAEFPVSVEVNAKGVSATSEVGANVVPFEDSASS